MAHDPGEVARDTAAIKGDEAGFSAASVRKVIRAGTDVKAVAADAVLLLAKAVDEFTAVLVDRAAAHMVADGRREMSYADVATAVEETPCLDFLADVVPQKVTAAKYLQAALQQP